MEQKKVENEKSGIIQVPSDLNIIPNFTDFPDLPDSKIKLKSRSGWKIFPLPQLFIGPLLVFDLTLLVTVDALMYTWLRQTLKEQLDSRQTTICILIQILWGLTASSNVFQAFENSSRVFVSVLTCLKISQVLIVSTLLLLGYANDAKDESVRRMCFAFVALGLIAIYNYIFFFFLDLNSNFDDESDSMPVDGLSQSEEKIQLQIEENGEMKEEGKERVQMTRKIFRVFAFVENCFSLALVINIVPFLDLEWTEQPFWIFYRPRFGLLLLAFSSVFCLQVFGGLMHLNALLKEKERSQNQDKDSDSELLIISSYYQDSLQIHILTSLQLTATLIVLGTLSFLGEAFNYILIRVLWTLGPLLIVNFVNSILGQIFYNQFQSGILNDDCGRKIMLKKMQV